MSLLLEVKSTPALIIKAGFILVVHMDQWHWWVHNVQPAATNARSKPQPDCQQSTCNAMADPVLHHILYSYKLCVSLGNFSINTQVWNRLCHRDCRQRGVLCVIPSYGSCNSNPY